MLVKCACASNLFHISAGNHSENHRRRSLSGGAYNAWRNDPSTGNAARRRRDTRDQRPTGSTSDRQPAAKDAGEFRQ